ncbi:dimethylsulfoniopropionate demethylase, partial [Pseudomonadota bacterium]
DYHHLKRHVQVWDVSCERQVEITGPDAFRLVQLLTPRDVSHMQDDQCYYVPMVDESGGMLNDPVALRIDDQKYWISIADSDVLLWAKGIAAGMRLEVDVYEPDVSPLAIQGPKADELMARVFGDPVRDIRFFRYKKLPFNGREMVVARSGYSKQGGFEIYVDGSEYGEPLWDALFAAGEDLEVRAGCPNLIERIESGLLSYGSDMTRDNTPHECGLQRFCDTRAAIGCIGRDALLRMLHDGPSRQIRGLRIQGDTVPPCTQPWPVYADGHRVGQVTSAAWSPDLGVNVSIGMIDASHWDAGTHAEVDTPDGMREAEVAVLPFFR